MSTRSKSDKKEIDEIYKSAIENQNKKQPSTSTLYTSTPTTSINPTPRAIKFLPDVPEGTENQSEEFPSETLTDDSSSFENQTLLPAHNPDRKKNLKIMAYHNPFATLKYAVEAVPFFDGQNIPLTYFIEGCEEAKSMLPEEAEPQFTKIIRTRIVGEARRTIQDQDFDSVAQLTKYLEQIYGPAKNIYQLQGELGCIYQKNAEDVITYANRVKLLGKRILEAHKNSGNIASSETVKASIEKDMCKCFIRGLKPEIEQRVKRDLDVQGTVADALRIERELREMTDLRQGNTSNKTSNTNHPRETCQICYKEGHLASNCRKLTQSYNNSALGTEILTCQICKKRGHSADKCRLRDPQTRRPINVIQGRNIVCQLCSKPGHNAKSCRISNNQNNHDKPSVICQWCDKPGHSANNCWKKQNEQQNTGNRSKIVCHICNNFGHIAKECRSKMGQDSAPVNSVFCRYCKERGHLLENCELRIASNNRRKANNQGNSDGPSKSGVEQGSERISHPVASKKTTH